MNKTIKALSVYDTLKLALEALKDARTELCEWSSDVNREDYNNPRLNDAITAICVALASKSEALAEQPAQQEEIDELTAQRDMLADILTRTANALKGQPPELVSHSWHDLPEVAQQLKAAQRKPWTGLTDEEIEDAWPFVWRKHESVRHFAIYHAIEAKLRELNEHREKNA